MTGPTKYLSFFLCCWGGKREGYLGLKGMGICVVVGGGEEGTIIWASNLFPRSNPSSPSLSFNSTGKVVVVAKNFCSLLPGELTQGGGESEKFCCFDFHSTPQTALVKVRKRGSIESGGSLKPSNWEMVGGGRPT
jgi:hypothetical protein